DGRRVRHAAHLRAAAADQDRLLPAGSCHRCRRVHAGRARALRAVRRRRLCAVLPEHRGLLGGQAPPRRGEVMTRTTLAALALLATMSPAAAQDWTLAYPKQGETQRDLPKGVTLYPNPVKTIKIDTRLDPKPVKIIRIFRPPARCIDHALASSSSTRACSSCTTFVSAATRVITSGDWIILGASLKPVAAVSTVASCSSCAMKPHRLRGSRAMNGALSTPCSAARLVCASNSQVGVQSLMLYSIGRNAFTVSHIDGKSLTFSFTR